MLPKEYFEFFRMLNKNNNKEWFDANKKTYEASVKAPLYALIDKLIEEIAVYEPTLHTSVKDCVFRINRDIRFSKDKQPYKTALGAHISAKGRKDMAYPAFYFEAGMNGISLGGGAYMPDKDQLASLRDLLMHENKEWRALIGAKSFTEKFGEIRGEKNKVLPAEFRTFAEKEPLLFNKQFYWWADLPESIGTSAKCTSTLMQYYKAAHPLSEFLRKVF